ncbi:DUF5696 domain-containing protein [Paenibacillus sp. Marseille-Q4541]|uniref:DUF5696 domain-containing protein n=1 Tax=Paenibacillus sp. Marseille-Q4541 TaxID=2831522 RepID=UPI001BA746B8|nr:DUF5696 domain-containing protein [Paenibacillus sp. Marseille-Q4541]
MKSKWTFFLALVLWFSSNPYFGSAAGQSNQTSTEWKGSIQLALEDTKTTSEEMDTESIEDAAVQGAEQAEKIEEPGEVTGDVSAADEGEVSAGTGKVQPILSLGPYPISATKKVTENEKLELYIDEKTGNIRLIDKITGKEWLGAPQVDRTTMPNNKKYMDSPLHIKYTEGADTVQTHTLKEKENELTIEYTEQGAKLHFLLSVEKLEISMEYRLLDSGLEVVIPEESIKETGTARIVSLEPLPFFNAASGQDKGALFIPDGSGALIEYKKDHPMFYSGYSEYVYGSDPIYVSAGHSSIDANSRKVNPPKENIAMPVFGNYREDVGFLGIVTEGDYDAKINATPSGIRNIPLYRVSSEFVYRKDDVIFIGSSGQIPFYQGERIPGERRAQYVLLQGEDADYVGMAKAYREYLTSSKGVTPITEDASTMSIRLVGGITRDEIIGKTFIEMTTFREAQEMIDHFAKEGMTNLRITLEGYGKDGLYGDQPKHFPISKKLGGEKDLQELTAYAKGHGINLYVEANYARAFEDSGGIRKNKDGIRGMDRELAVSSGYEVSSGWNDNSEIFYWLKPDRIIEKYVNKEKDKFKKLGVAGIQFAYWGETLFSDLDPKSISTRQSIAEKWINAVDTVRAAELQTGVSYGNAYTYGHIDNIDHAPLDSSHFIFSDETVPFYQIVLRGLIPYTASPTNLRDDAVMEKLRMIEYGALPSMRLTYQPTSQLQRTMEDELWSSEYTYWTTVAAEEFGQLQELYQHLDGAAITDHNEIESQVYVTTYSNGTSVYVNYSTKSFEADGVDVPALGYAVHEGGGA